MSTHRFIFQRMQNEMAFFLENSFACIVIESASIFSMKLAAFLLFAIPQDYRFYQYSSVWLNPADNNRDMKVNPNYTFLLIQANGLLQNVSK